MDLEGVNKIIIATVGILFLACLLVLSIGLRAGAEGPVTLERRGYDPTTTLAHAGDEWQRWQAPGGKYDGGIHQFKPKGYPLDESETPVSYSPENNTFNGSKALGSYVPKGDLSLAVAILSLGSALLLGSAHALSPGHGKTMVAAYLIGSRGTRRDAVLLGGIVTFTHVISVLLLGLLCLTLSKHVVSQKLFPWLGAASGGVIFMVGYWMLAKRALGLDHGHSHHSHNNGAQVTPYRNPHKGPAEVLSLGGMTTPLGSIAQHDHYEPGCDHEPDEHCHAHEQCPADHIGRVSLVPLGLAGGIVLCPTALVILLSAISLGRVGFGLLLIIFFSLGLAAVLIVIGLLTVTASRLSDRISEHCKWIQVLPVLSAGVVMIIGIGIAFNSLVAGGILTINR
ncbi:MAG: nickel/cobalt transporter [Desulfomonilaceae bacterium]